MKKLIKVLLLVLVLGLSSNCFAQERVIESFDTTIQFQRYTMTDAFRNFVSATIQTADIKMLLELADNLGFSIDITEVSPGTVVTNTWIIERNQDWERLYPNSTFQFYMLLGGKNGEPGRFWVLGSK